MKLTIGGDLNITPPFLTSDLFDHELVNLFEKSDFNIINLECPVTEENFRHQILKTGSHLRTDKGVFEKLKHLKIDAVTLANNHILDYGQDGLKTTLDSLNNENIQYVGAGMSLKEAIQPLIIENSGLKIAVVNFCENEWSVASQLTGGANPMNTIDNLKQIRESKRIADYVIVVVHGGHEDYHLPSPRMVKLYRFFAENGADAIIGHHPQCISGFEIYNNVPILYGIGIFIDTRVKKNKACQIGLLVQLIINKNMAIQMELIPIKQKTGTFSMSLIDKIENEEVMKQINYLSNIIGNHDLFTVEWEKFIESKKKTLNMFSPVNSLPGKYIRVILNRLGVNQFFLREKYLKNLLNHIRCEAHRDIVTTLIEKHINKS